MKNKTLPHEFNLRPAAHEDLQAVVDAVYAACAADGDATMAFTADELEQEWKSINLETDAWVVTDPAGKIVGYEEFFNRYEHASLQGDGYVHPEYTGLGVGSSLLAALVERARQEVPLAAPDMRVFLRNGVGIHEKNAAAIHEEAGFKAIRYSWRMEISLDSLPDAAVMPNSIELRPFDFASQDHQVYLAHEDAFHDHWGHTPREYSFWQTNISGHPDFDPAQWYIAWDGAEIAGYSLCRSRQGIGWVGTLGVRRRWRKQGLGMALLKHSFRELYQRGYTTIGLTVDASNPTGATRLYERAGMHIAHEFVVYEKEIRPGREPEQ